MTEALARGVPVVAYAAGGIRLQIHDGEGAYVVPVGDRARVVGILRRLLGDERERARQSRLAEHRARVLAFGPAVNAAGWLRLAIEGRPWRLPS